MCYNTNEREKGTGEPVTAFARGKAWDVMRIEKKRWKTRALAAAFAILTTAVLAACGKEKTEDDGKDFVYVPEFVSLEGDFGFSDFAYGGGFFYYTAYTENEDDALYQYDPAAKTTRKLSLPEGEEGASRRKTIVDEEGNLYIIYVNWHYNEANPENSYMENYLAKYDAGMNQIFLNDITDRLRSDEDEGYI